MKKAKVSSVYEGRGRKGDNSSKSARMAAKGRRDGVRARKALSFKPKHRAMVTRSMKVRTMEEMLINEENFREVVIMQAKLDENGYIKPIEVLPEQSQEVVQQQPQEVVQQQQQQEEEVVQPPVNAVATVAGDDWDLFPRDEWLLMNMTSDGWYAYWEELTGEFWTQPFIDDRERPIWNDLWDFNDGNYLYWEALTGEFWPQPFMDDREQLIWGDLWDYNDDNYPFF